MVTAVRGTTLSTSDWDDFRLFAAVVRAGSFTRAARDLGLSEPTISRRIKRLEGLLGARLFDRGKGAPRLTRDGERVLDFANAAEHSLSRAVFLTREAVKGSSGDCSVVMGEGLGGFWMPGFLPSFYERHPAIDMRLFTTQTLAQDQTHTFDVQIQYLQPLESHNVAMRLATMHFMLYGTEGYFARFGVPRSIDDLRRHRVADSATTFTTRGSLMSWANINKNPAFLTNSGFVLGEVVRAGAALALLPTYFSALFPDLGTVLPDLHYAAPVFLCFERASGLKPAVRTAIDFLKRHVFDSKRMPWFAERFAPPQKGWRAVLESCIARAARGK